VLLILRAGAFLSLSLFASHFARSANPPDQATILNAKKQLVKAMIDVRLHAGDDKNLMGIDAEICRAQADVGDIAGALDTVLPLPETLRTSFYGYIAAAPPGRIDSAGRKRMDLLPEPFHREFAARYFAEEGNIDAAILTANNIPDLDARFYILCNMASGRLDKGDKAQALKYLKNAGRLLDGRATLELTEAVQGFARFQTLAGDVPGAIATAAQIEDKQKHQELLFDIARWQAFSGNLPGARKTAALLTDLDSINFENQIIVISDLMLHARAGDLIEAKKLAAGLKGDADMFQTAIFDIAESQARFGDWPGVQETLSPIPESLDKADMFVGIAEDFARAGYVHEMNEAVAAAMTRKNLPTIYQYESFRAYGLAAALSLTGDPDGAIAAVNQSTDDPYSRCHCFWEAILELSKT
jgi:hypothetical protein